MNDKKTSILIIDDDEKFTKKVKANLATLGDIIINEGYSEAEFYNLFKPGKYNAIILDMRLDSGYEGMGLLEYALNEDPTASIIMLTGYASIETAIRSLKLGAKDYLEKERYDDKSFLSMVQKVIIEDKAKRMAARVIADSEPEIKIIGNDVKIKKLLKFADWLAEEKETPILLVGEEGTEKETVAEYIYKKSGVKGKFVKKNIGTNENEIQSELFGDDKNFGLIKEARGGVLYLEEVFRLSSNIQQKMLDFINTGILKQDKKKQEEKVKVQLILSTSQSLDQLKNSKELDSAFFYRVKSLELFIPPLRERGDDIMLTVQYFLSLFKKKAGEDTVNKVSDGVVEIFSNYKWPGNLLELKQIVESSAFRAKLDGSSEIKEKHLPLDLQKGIITSLQSNSLNLDKILALTTLRYMKIALEKSGGAKIEAYRYLGYPVSKRGTLNSRLKKIFEIYPDLAGSYNEIYQLYKAT